MCKKANIDKFYNSFNALVEYWFDDKESSQLITQMSDYVIETGHNAKPLNSLAMQTAKNGGKFRQFFRIIFMPYKDLKILYPIIIKHKILTPFCQIARWCSRIKNNKGRRAINRLKQTKRLDKDRLARAKYLICELELN